MITHLHHAQITIPRGAEAQARSFYCDLLALPEIPKPDSLLARGGFWLAVGDQAVHVGVEDGVDRWATKAHLAYAVSDLDHWRRTLTDQGIELHEAVPIPGFARFEFRDPFGNRIEMIQPTP
ncbi:MAG: VOC family protein [Phycisphaeraceae bacterium]|nr:VOC family protein [Phycisphaeraceae bacterium]